MKFWGQVLWHLWIGGARKPGPGLQHATVEVFNVGGWLTHGDFALEAEVDYLAVVEHRLILVGVRSEWAGVKTGGTHMGSCHSGFLSCGECWHWEL